MTAEDDGGGLDAPVLIIGAGPVGTTLAMDLARLGVRSILVEQRREMPPNPRCNTTNARSMELFRRLACADAVRAAGLPEDFNTDVVYMTRLNGREICRFERSTPADVRAGTQHGVASNWPTPEPQHCLSQIYLEPVLREHAVRRWAVDLRAGWRLESVEGGGDAVVGVLSDSETGQQQRLRARYLVGCDGASSLVRKAIGSRLEGTPGMANMCSTYFRSRRVGELARARPGWMLRFVGGGVLVAIDGGDEWLLHTGVPRDEDPATWDPEPAMFRAIGEPFEYSVIDRSRWTPKAMIADRWRDGNVFLAGDAAHVWVPMGGFGMNAGVADAVSLSWRLAAVLGGWGGDALLDSYQAERAPIGESIAGQAVTWALSNGVLCADAPGRVELLESGDSGSGSGPSSEGAAGVMGAAARAEMAEGVRREILSEFECPGFQLGYVYRDSPVGCRDTLTAEPEEMLVDYRPTSWPGARLPHVWVDEGVSVYDLLGPFFTLLRVRSGSVGLGGGALVEAAAGSGVPLVVVDVDGARVGDAWEGMALVLVRPDQHIAWRSVTEPTSEEALRVINRVTGGS